MLKLTCADMDAEMPERQNTRALETEARSKALAVLSGDDAHDLFTQTVLQRRFCAEVLLVEGLHVPGERSEGSGGPCEAGPQPEVVPPGQPGEAGRVQEGSGVDPEDG